MKVLKKLFVILFVFVFATGCGEPSKPSNSDYQGTSVNNSLLG